MEISSMTVEQLKIGIANKSLVLHKKKIYTSEEWSQIKEAERQEEHYDLLQLTKKIQL